MELPGGGSKALKILAADGGPGAKTWYYVEARAAVGFNSSIVPGVLIHTGAESSGNTRDEIDLAPATTTFDSLLEPGQTSTDPAIGLSITTLSADAAGATVSVRFGPSICTNAAPIINISPVQRQAAKAGTAVTVAHRSGVDESGRLQP